MNEDIRLLLTFRHHRKRKRLFHRLGSDGILSLINLWCMTAEQYPNGCLKGYTKEDVEIDAGWQGKSGDFFDAILDIGFLDNTEKGFYLHNWHKHQVWVFKSEERSNISRLNIMSKKHNRIFKELQAMNIKSINRSDYELLTNNQATLKQRLKDFKQRLSNAISDASKNVSEFKPNAHVPAPLPLPSPLPSPVPLHKRTPAAGHEKFKPPSKKKKTPGTNPGIFKNKNLDVKNSDFSINLSDIFLSINSRCKEISKLPKTSKRKKEFNPMAWAQKKINIKKHPGAIEKSLDGLKTYWDRSRDPWAYANNILSKINGTFNEAEAIEINEYLKNIPTDNELSSLISGMFKGV